MKIREIISMLETWAPPVLQESYDNAGLLTGDRHAECTAVLVCLDAVEAVVQEAIEKKCNLIIAHHPIIFKGLKSITGRTYVERVVLQAIRNDIAIYALHTNLDNVLDGVSGKMAERIGLDHTRVLDPKPGTLKKLYTYVPAAQVEAVRDALFAAGGGQIGQYSECSFSAPGTGTFRAGEGANPFAGKKGERHQESEFKLELILPGWLESTLVNALKKAHPYEEVAYEIISLDNRYLSVGAGLVGELETEMAPAEFLRHLASVFGARVIRHTRFPEQRIRTVALCGGAGSFLVSRALSAKADAFVSADFKYHEFFDADGRLLICDIGHYESEQYTLDLIKAKIEQKFPNFAVLKTGVNTNPVSYSCQ